MRRWRFFVAGIAVALALSASIGRVRAQGGPAAFYGIGQLAGGLGGSSVTDATMVGGTIYAVGQASRVTNSDTPFLWVGNGGSGSFTELPLDPPFSWSTSFAPGPAITPDSGFIASAAHNNPLFPASISAVRVIRGPFTLTNEFLNLLGFNNGAQRAVAISDDGTILYGITQGHSFTDPTQPGPSFDGINRTLRFDLNTFTTTWIRPLSGMTHSAPVARGTSSDGSVVVGTSWNTPYDAFAGSTNGRGFRYRVNPLGIGTLSAIPLIPPEGTWNGTWNKAIAVSANGNLTLVAGDSPTNPKGELYLYDATTNSIMRLGSPNSGTVPANSGGMNEDGSLVFSNIGNTVYPYFHNSHGWFNLKSALAAQGIDVIADGWTAMQVAGVRTREGRDIVFGNAFRIGRPGEGFIADFPAGFLANFDVPQTARGDSLVVGVWIHENPNDPNDQDVLALVRDGSYMHVKAGGVVPAGSAPGVEAGLYTTDPATGAFTVTTISDSNGNLGMSDLNGSLDLTFTVSGDTATLAGGLTSSRFGNGVFTRVPYSPGSIVGGWPGGSPAVALDLFLPNGHYYQAFSAPGVGAGFASGLEYGTYSWDSMTGALAVIPLLNTLGPGRGLSADGNLTFVLTPDDQRLFITSNSCSTLPSGKCGPFVRIIDPAIVTPVITSELSATATSGYFFAYQVAATNIPSSFGASGLPGGLGINTSTGLISGTATQTGLFDVTISASNAISTGSAHLSLAVVAPLVTRVGSNVLVTTTAPPGADPINLVSNGGFEGGLGAWTFTNGVGASGGGVYNPGQFPSANVTEGFFAFDMGIGGITTGSSLSQVISTVAGQSYTLTFDWGSEYDWGTFSTVTIGNLSASLIDEAYDQSPLQTWIQHSATFTFVANGNDVLTFTDLSGQDAAHSPSTQSWISGLALDNISIVANQVPNPVHVSIEFAKVTQGGVTAVSTIDRATVPPSQALPQGFSLGDPPAYYEIQTTARFSGTVTVCFNYSGMTFTGFPRLLHYDGGLATWVDITTSVDTTTTTICGLTSSFSPFAIASSSLASTGFRAPVNPIAGDVNVVKGGSTVPLKFNVYGSAGVEITSAENIANLTFKVASIPCTIGAPEDWVDIVTTGATSLRYSGHEFIQNWKTPNVPGCYLIRVTGDGLLLSAKFKVR